MGPPGSICFASTQISARFINHISCPIVLSIPNYPLVHLAPPAQCLLLQNKLLSLAYKPLPLAILLAPPLIPGMDTSSSAVDKWEPIKLNNPTLLRSD